MFGLRLGAMGRVGSGLTLTQAAANVRAAYSTSPQVWYDPSDLSTLYQDSAGTTPVTAVGQPVGLMLDKSRGLVLGSERITNGGFDADTNWTKGSNWTISGGVATSSGANSVGEDRNLKQFGAFVVGKTYRVTGTITSGAARTGNLSVTIDSNFGPSLALLTPSSSYPINFSAAFTATQTTLVIATSAAAGGTTACSLDNISVRELPGLHASQPTALARPVLQQENGLLFLLCDGTDDGMVTPSWDLTSTDKVTVVAGVRKLSDAAAGVVAEFSATLSGNTGAFVLFAPPGIASPAIQFNSKGTASAGASTSSVAAPITAIATGIGNIGGDSVLLRLNGVQVAQSTTDQGTGTYNNLPLYLFRRGGTSLPFNGRFYGLSIIGAQLSASDINVLERFTATKTGVTLP